MIPTSVGRRKVDATVDDNGVMNIVVDGIVVHRVAFQVGCELRIDAGMLYTFKTTIGPRGRYGKRKDETVR